MSARVLTRENWRGLVNPLVRRIQSSAAMMIDPIGSTLLALLVARSAVAEESLELRLARSKTGVAQEKGWVDASFGNEMLMINSESALTAPDIRTAQFRLSEPPPSAHVEQFVQAGAVGVDTTRHVQVLLTLTDFGKGRMARLTTEHIGERVAIFYRGNIAAAPVIRERISGAELVIDNVTEEVARQIVAEFRNQNEPPNPAMETDAKGTRGSSP